MTIARDLHKPERKLSKRWLGYAVTTVLAIAGALFALYLNGLHPQLYYDVQSSTSVLELKEELPKLDIQFDGIDIRQQKLSLQIIYVKIINDSTKDILRSFYDQRDPIGLRVSAGKIIKADIVDTSREYLTKSLSICGDGMNTIYFNDIIIAAHQYFLLKLLVLHPTDQIPAIKPIGYVAGMTDIKLRETYKEKGKPSIWLRAFSGSWLVQSLRLLVYFLGAGTVGLLFASLIIKAGEYIDNKKLKRNVKKYRKSTTLSLNESDEFIFSRYIWGRDGELKLIKWILNDDDSIKRAWADANNERQFQASYKLPKILQKGYPSTHNQLMLTRIDALVEDRFIQEDKGVLIVDPHMKETLTNFLAYLRDRGLTED